MSDIVERAKEILKEWRSEEPLVFQTPRTPIVTELVAEVERLRALADDIAEVAKQRGKRLDEYEEYR